MKKHLIIIFLCLILIIPFSVLLNENLEAADKPSKTNKSANTDKTEIKKPIKRIDTMIAVFDLETSGNVDKYISRPLSESIRREVFKSGKWELIDRGNMDKVFSEQKFQLSGCVTGQCIVEAGQMLGVGKIVAGTVSLIGKTYYLSLSLINAETGKIEAQSEDKCKCELDELIDSSKRLIAKLIGESTGSPVKEQTQKTFSLEELEQNMKRDKADWDKKTEQMKLAYNKVLEYEKKENISPETKANAWKHFSDSFKEDNPQSKEDDKMRKKAKNQNEYWQKMAKRPKGWTPPPPFKDSVTDMEFVYVDGGCFQMGDVFGDGEASDEKPVHEVCVDDFYIGKYEVTQGQWKAIMGDNPSKFDDCGDNCPVENVSWNDIQGFITKLNQQTVKNYRLPTEAEWEYAAKSGGKNEKYAGTSNESELEEYAWYSKNSGKKTHPVGQKQPNGLGIYDMSGNVWEWVNDWYDKDSYKNRPDSYYYKNSPKNNPKGPNSGPGRILRGGGWRYDAGNTRTAHRFGVFPDFRYKYYHDDFGIRLVSPVK